MRLAFFVALFVSLSVLATGCSVRRGAPVVERAAGSKPGSAPSRVGGDARGSSDVRPEFYTVRKGDTLFSIALDQGLDYRELADWNGISDPGVIRAGQTLRLMPPRTANLAPLKSSPAVEGHPIGGAPQAGGSPASRVKTEPKATRAPYTDQTYAQLVQGTARSGSSAEKTTARPAPRQEPAGEGDVIAWVWPANGKVISTFNDSAKLKGISIAGKLGQPVTASAAGRVIFSGSGIRGFGKLIVIKHNDTFLSVYAHNSELLVKEGQSVTKGQKIAEMGKSDTDQVKLHFEIRRFGKPVDPMTLLPQG